LGCAPPGIAGRCAPEWAIKNLRVSLAPGCNTYTSPEFQVGRKAGGTWMRMTLTPEPVPDDFPWNGSLSTPNHSFSGGETEDYPVTIVSPTTDVALDTPSDGLWFAAPSPNPGLHATMVRFGLANETPVRLTVYDLFGRRVKRLVDDTLSAGPHAIEWDYKNTAGATVPAGFYVLKLDAGGRMLTQRAIVAR